MQFDYCVVIRQSAMLATLGYANVHVTPVVLCYLIVICLCVYFHSNNCTTLSYLSPRQNTTRKSKSFSCADVSPRVSIDPQSGSQRRRRRLRSPADDWRRQTCVCAFVFFLCVAICDIAFACVWFSQLIDWEAHLCVAAVRTIRRCPERPVHVYTSHYWFTTGRHGVDHCCWLDLSVSSSSSSRISEIQKNNCESRCRGGIVWVCVCVSQLNVGLLSISAAAAAFPAYMILL